MESHLCVQKEFVFDQAFPFLLLPFPPSNKTDGVDWSVIPAINRAHRCPVLNRRNIYGCHFLLPLFLCRWFERVSPHDGATSHRTQQPRDGYLCNTQSTGIGANRVPCKFSSPFSFMIHDHYFGMIVNCLVRYFLPSSIV